MSCERGAVGRLDARLLERAVGEPHGHALSLGGGGNGQGRTSDRGHGKREER